MSTSMQRHSRAKNLYQITSQTFTLNMFVMAVSSCKNICYTLLGHHPKNIAPVLIISSPRLSERNPTLSNMGAKIELNKKHHCVQTHNPCRGSRLRAKIRKWRVALLQVVTRGLSGSSPSSRSSLTLESAWGKATFDIMKHSLTGPLSSLLSRSLPWRIVWLKPFCTLL